MPKSPAENREKWVLTPKSLQGRLGRRACDHRPKSEWVGRVISAIGKKSEIIVAEEEKSKGKPAKYVSAHDLRRPCGQRMRSAGVPPLVIRHPSWETTQEHFGPGDVHMDGNIIWEILADLESEASK